MDSFHLSSSQLHLPRIPHSIGPFPSGSDCFVGKFWVPHGCSYALLFAITTCCYWMFLAPPIYILGFRGDSLSPAFVEDVMCGLFFPDCCLVMMMKFGEILKIPTLLCSYFWKFQSLCHPNHCVILPLWCSSIQLGLRKISFELYHWVLIIEVWLGRGVNRGKK